MGYGNTSSTDAARPELWGKQLMQETLDSMYFTENGLMGEDDNNIIVIKNDLKKDKGDTITFPFVPKLSKAQGVTGDSELEGNEQTMTTYTEQVAIDQWRDAVRLKGRLDDKKNAFSMRTAAKDNLKMLGREFLEMQFFLKLGGVTNTSLTDCNGNVVGTHCTWSNTPDYIPDAHEATGTGARYIAPAATTAFTASTIFTPSLIDIAVRTAQTASPKIQPLRVNGEDFWVLFIHPYQAYDLRRNPEWQQAMREAEVRGPKNPIFSGAFGIWNHTIVKVHDYVPYLDASVAGNSFRGVSSGTDCAFDACRALFCGKGAAVYAQCDNDNAWAEEKFDYGNKWGFSCSLMGGIQKTVFNSKEYGVIAIDTTWSGSVTG
jgi:N4-gp56 family major capsid protein